MLLVDAEQSRQLDAEMQERFNFPSLILMENAGRKLAEFLDEKYGQKAFLILSGPGNNGGDGLVAARYLWQKNKNVSLVFSVSPENLKGDAKSNFEILKRTGILFFEWEEKKNNPASLFSDNTVLVDSLLGTGIKDALKGSVAEMVTYFRAQTLPVVAVDLPSGLNADTGNVLTIPIRADFSFTFQQPKRCHFVQPAAAFCGEIVVADIGVFSQVLQAQSQDCTLITPKWCQEKYIPRHSNSHKGSFGHVLIVAGSKEMAGSAALCGAGALSVGAGLVTAFVPGTVRAAFYQKTHAQMCISWKEAPCFDPEAIPDFLIHLKGKQVLVLGPGIGTSDETIAFVEGILPHVKIPIVLDADALNILALRPELWNHLNKNCIITPHPGEMKKITGDENCNAFRLETAINFASKRNVTVVLKGAGTLIASPEGITNVIFTGNSGLSTGGTGDVLSGMIGGMLATGYSSFEGASFAAYLHGLAGDLGAAKNGQEALSVEILIEYVGPAFLQTLSSQHPPFQWR